MILEIKLGKGKREVAWSARAGKKKKTVNFGRWTPPANEGIEQRKRHRPGSFERICERGQGLGGQGRVKNSIPCRLTELQRKT